MRHLLLAGLTLCLFGAAGCAGQLKAAMKEHAESAKSVAGTISKSTPLIKCEDMKQESMDSCKTAVSTINDQAKVLSDSSAKLNQAAQ